MSKRTRMKGGRSLPTPPNRGGLTAPARPAEGPGSQADAARPAPPAPAGPDIATRPTHERIAVRAYEIWESRGRPDGADQAHWFEAERQLGAEA